MAKDKLTQYDSVASNNTDLGGISVAEGMLPSGVNNAIREQMSHLADFAAGTSGVDVLKLQDDTDTNSIKLQAPSSVTADTTFTLPDGDGSADQVLKTDGSGQLGWVAQTAVAANPSLIINGAMTVAQRSTSVTGVTSGTAYLTCDRWRVDGTIGTWTVSQSTDAPEGFSNSFKLECTTNNASPGADTFRVFQQYIEGQNLQHLKYGTSNAQDLTLSFWVKSSKTGEHTGYLYQDDDTRLYSWSYNVSTANTWEHKTITIDGDTTGILDNDNGVSLRVTFMLAAGSNRATGSVTDAWGAYVKADESSANQVNLADTVGNEWYITGVKLEVGSTATDFIHEDYGTTLAKCIRYYTAVSQYIPSSSSLPTNWFFSSPMRDTPTVTCPSAGFGTFGTNEYRVASRKTSAGTATITADAEL